MADLELRLAKYHEWLEHAIAERDRLALDAAWGVHAGLYTNGVTAAIWLTVYNVVGLGGWWQSGLAVGLSFVAYFAVYSWSNGERMKEVDRLAKLPEWEWKD
jgi:hypothetical protein